MDDIQKTARALADWARAKLIDPSVGSRASRLGGFCFTIDELDDPELAAEYGVRAAVISTRHCTDCGDFLLYVPTGQPATEIMREALIGDSSKGTVRVGLENLESFELSDLRFERPV